MFTDLQQTLIMIEGAYKKLKSYYYYDKTQLHIKSKISSIENDPNLFMAKLKEISENLVNKSGNYFNNLVENISFVIVPKNMDYVEITNDIVKNNMDVTKQIKKINFYIDPPIELLILDCLWMLLIGKIAVEHNRISEYSYATKYKRSVINKSEKDLCEGIDFHSNRCFVPYYNNYLAWRNNAFKTVESEIKEQDLVLMNLDIKSFYYSVCFDFDLLNNILENDERFQSIEFLTNIMKSIYKKYTAMISEYKPNISLDGCILPIGLLSPLVLRELYLYDFDSFIIKTLKPKYYGRYVDDIIFVFDATDEENFTKRDYFDKHVILTHIVTPSDKEDLKLVMLPNLKIQKDKANCIYFKKGTKNVLLNAYLDKIKEASSEANLLPDLNYLEKSFDNNVYDVNSLNGSHKIYDLDILTSNSYNAIMYILGLTRLMKNTKVNPNKIKKQLDQIMFFYKDSHCIEYFNHWKSIFELFVIAGDKDRANNFYKQTKNYINSFVNFDYLNNNELKKRKFKASLKSLKESLILYLDISVSQAFSLNIEMAKLQKHKEIATHFQRSNMFNHNLVSIPLLNYSKFTNNNNISFLDCTILNSYNENLVLDNFKIKWSPRFIHFDQLLLYSFFVNYHSLEKLDTEFYSRIYQTYLKFNNIRFNPNSPIEDVKSIIYNDNVNQIDFVFNNSFYQNGNIGLVNTFISEEEAFNHLVAPENSLSIDNKHRLYSILNTAKQEKVAYLVFPEFYMDVFWLNDILKFAKNNNITIITGLQYLQYTINSKNKTAYNMVCVLKPVRNEYRYVNSILLFREKNFYAPSERIGLSKKGYLSAENKRHPQYFVLNDGNTKFSTILCYEFTDIISRASMKSKVDMLFVPQLNRDTNYFSNIVESSARDLHCFIIQSNTSKYGDSRITAPKETQLKNIALIKGGINDVLLVANIDIKSLHDAQKEYNYQLKLAIERCFDCKKIHNKTPQEQKRKCSNCKYNLSTLPFKGTPPNFDL